MARDWSRERWVKLFTRDSGRYLMLPLSARGIYHCLQRVCDADGRIEFEGGGLDTVAALLRGDVNEVELAVAELSKAGLVVVHDDCLLLPEHLEQQLSRTDPALRQRQARERNSVTLSDTKTDSVTLSDIGEHSVTECHDKKRKDQIEKKRAEQIARAREPAAATPSSTRVEEVPSDPRIAMLASKLRAAKRFSHLPSVQVAEGLVGKLGTGAFNLDEDKADEAIAAATLEAEDGANERRLRQLLGWKLVDALSGRQRAAKGHMVQGLGGQTFEEFKASIERDQEWTGPDENGNWASF